MRFGQGQTEVVAHPVDVCVQGNAAFVVAEITHSSGNFAGIEGQFLQFGFLDTGGSGDLVLISLLPPFFFISPVQGPACDLLGAAVPIAAVDRGGWQVKP